MTLNLYTNYSEKNKLDKEIEDIVSLSGTLKENTSIVDPIVTIESDLINISKCNYAQILEFNRFYFVQNIVIIRNKILQISMHCDVLSSFKNEIRENTAIIRRQEKNWNLYLDDGLFKVYQNPMVLTKAFPNGFTTQEFVLAVAGS